MGDSDTFLGFENALHFFAFLTQVIYNLIPIIFLIQVFNNVIKVERISVISLLCLYLNGFTYFWTSVFTNKNEIINPLDFAI